MHDCPECGQACYCDLDDTCLEDEHGMPLEECLHACDPADMEDSDDLDYDPDRCAECDARIGYGESHDPECSHA